MLINRLENSLNQQIQFLVQWYSVVHQFRLHTTVVWRCINKYVTWSVRMCCWILE